MHFCMVTTFYPPYSFGGDAIFVQQLSNELAKRGHHVDVVHCKDTFDLMTDRRPAAVREDHPNVRVHTLDMSAGMLSPLATHLTGRPIFKSSRLREILEQPFDVIHYHNVSLVGGPDVLRYGRAAKLYTLHEYWLVCPTHMLFKFNREACTARQCLSCSLWHGRPPQVWRYTDLIDQSVKHIDLFLAPSAFTREKHRELGLDVPIVELPYFSSRWESRRAEAAPVPGQPPYFLFVGRLEKIKGVQTLIPLFRRYDNAQLWIVGTGRYERVLQRMAQGSSNIKFLGHQSGDRLRMLYEQAIATVVPSIWYEVFGIIILESFARGTPVIVRNIGGMPDIIEESGGGIVYDTDDELRIAMDRFVDNPGLRNELGRRGHAALHQKWTADAHIPRYIGHIEHVLQRRQRKVVEAEAS
jgi:glycosyltransferase involved in cell wall biosynthesis